MGEQTAVAVGDGRDDGVVSYDGRRARRDRNNEAVIKACWELFAEGEMYPTAQQVAERSGVSLRSVFRHFQNLEALVATAVESYYEHSRAVWTFEPVPLDAPVEERIDALFAYRLRLYRHTGPVMRGAIARAARDPQLVEVVRESRARAIKLNEVLFKAEIDRLGPERRAVTVAALHSAAQFEVWDNLANLHGLDEEGVAAALRSLIRGALQL
jgi:TetR/AcrR family transcriptional regulator, regulator of autoinduction and epiphytic fitness